MDNRQAELLIDIQTRLERFWPLIEFFSVQENLTDYSTPVAEASLIVEQMIVLLAYEHGYYCTGGRVHLASEEGTIDFGMLSPLAFASSKKFEAIPQEIRSFVNSIRLQRNKAVHGVVVLREEMVVFSEAFDCFTSWFVVNSSTLANKEDAATRKFMSRITSLSAKMTLQIKRQKGEIEEHEVSTSIPMAKEAVGDKDSSESLSKMLLSKMDQVLDLQKELQSGVAQIDMKVNIIASKLDELSKQIGNYQSLLNRQIEIAVSEDEKDRIINAFSDECTNRIVHEINSASAEREFSVEKEKLIQSIGALAWEKLDPISQSFLITAKVTYNSLVTSNNAIDYSGVCLLVTKAIEVEMNNRFCRDFVAFLKEKYPGKESYCNYPTTLLNKYGKPLRPKEFTLGAVAYVLCFIIPEGLSEEKIETNRARLVEFMSERLMTGKSTASIDAQLEFIAEGVEEIRKDYRNPSAHINQLQCVNAKQCFDLVLDVEKLLKKILDGFDY